jgi:DUF4097 and DUF4098 domain-containing protein YvlB
MKKPIVIVLLTLALVFVLAGIGAVIFFASNGFSISSIDLDGPKVSATAEESKTLKVDGPVSLKVVDDAGDVIITGADVKEVTVMITKTGYGKSQAQADDVLSNIEYKVEQKDNSITLTFDYPKSNTNITQNVDFVVTVPFKTTVNVDAALGKLDLSGVQGDVILDNEFGDITVDKVEGALEIDTQSGRVEVTSVMADSKDVDIFSGFGSAKLEQVSGANIKVESNSGKLELKNVRATEKMDLYTKFGSLDFNTGSAGTMEAKTNSGSVTLTSLTIKGELIIKDEFGEIELEQVKAASYDIESNSGSITLDGVKSTVKAHTGFGNITIKNAEEATIDLDTSSGTIEFSGSLGEGPHTIHSDFGEIELNIPADAELTLDMETKFGKITSDIPITVTLTGDISKGQQSGDMNGGGAELKVDTNSGNIHIKILK